MIASAAPAPAPTPPLARLRRAVLIAALVVGTIVGLLISHADDLRHDLVTGAGAGAATATATATAIHHASDASAGPSTSTAGIAAGTAEATVATAIGQPAEAPHGDPLAVCLTVAACFAVLLLGLIGLRRLPAALRFLARTNAVPPASAPFDLPASVERRKLCVFLI
ncbi:hypothetical protein [Agromyces allii]|uniref:Uncharacterized protein n=1 Tax=Agromyces allii TaxID=393607 RepID=A0ABN2QU13_9MICO|nr:hypothetical protein [Agromyces allii]